MEWILLWGLLAAAAALVVRSVPRARGWIWVLVLVLGGGTAVAQSVWMAVRGEKDLSHDQLFATLPKKGRPGGYVSSDLCRSCHPSEYASWHRSYHRTMTQVASPETVRGRFEGQALKADDGRVYVLQRRGDEFWAVIEGVGEQRVNMLTGSHHMQVYWTATGVGNGQLEFPFTYLFDDQRWVGRRDVFLVGPEYPKSREIWNATCIECHATGGQPRVDAKTREPATHVGELGIACEACHGPGREHIEANLNPGRRYWLHLGGGSDHTITNPANLPALASAQVCGQCHSIGCNLQGWTSQGLDYRPGQDLEVKKPLVRTATMSSSPCRSQIQDDPTFTESRYWSDGMVRVSGRELNSLIESPCFKGNKISCVSCHSLHDSNPDDQLARQKDGNEACLNCHAEHRAKVQQHTHHAAGSPGSLCYNCHMPHTTYGLLTAMRSHTVSSPDVRRTLETGRPNACNLCHLDRTLAWTAKALKAWYGTPEPKLDDDERSVSAAVLDVLRGDAGKRALIAWSMGWGPAKIASGADWLAAYLGRLLDDPYAAVRYVGVRSLRTLPRFSDFQYDFIGPPEERAAARQRALETWQRTGPERPDQRYLGNQILVQRSGELMRSEVERLAAKRNDRQMFLAE